MEIFDILEYWKIEKAVEKLQSWKNFVSMEKLWKIGKTEMGDFWNLFGKGEFSFNFYTWKTRKLWKFRKIIGKVEKVRNLEKLWKKWKLDLEKLKSGEIMFPSTKPLNDVQEVYVGEYLPPVSDS